MEQCARTGILSLPSNVGVACGAPNNDSSNITDHGSQITAINTIMMIKLAILGYLPNVSPRHEVSKGFWKNGTNRVAGLRVGTDLRSVKIAISVDHHKVKCDKMKRASIAWNSIISQHFVSSGELK